MRDFINDSKYAGIKAFRQKLWLASPTMHTEECKKRIQAGSSTVVLLLP